MILAVWARYFSNGMDNYEAGEYESGQAKAAIAACVEAGAKHIVYSALDDTGAPHMSGKFKGTHLLTWAGVTLTSRSLAVGDGSALSDHEPVHVKLLVQPHQVRLSARGGRRILHAHHPSAGRLPAPQLRGGADRRVGRRDRQGPEGVRGRTRRCLLGGPYRRRLGRTAIDYLGKGDQDARDPRRRCLP
jgi:hypothetical protein